MTVWILTPLAILAVAQIIYSALAFRTSQVAPERLAKEFEEKLNIKDYQGAYEITKENHSVLGKSLGSFLAGVSQGEENANKQLKLTIDEERAKLNRGVNRLGWLSLLAPLCSTIISLFSLTSAFHEYAAESIDNISTRNSAVAKLSEEVSRAFIVMGEGLVICAIVLSAYFYFLGLLELRLAFVLTRVQELTSRFIGITARS